MKLDKIHQNILEFMTRTGWANGETSLPYLKKALKEYSILAMKSHTDNSNNSKKLISITLGR